MRYLIKCRSILVFQLLCLSISTSLYANPSSNDCILLGKEPSFIISFKNTKNVFLSKQEILKNLSSSKYTFSQIRSLREGRFIVFLNKLSVQKALFTSKNGCYSIKQVEAFEKELKSNTDILDVMPNIMMRPLEIDNSQLFINPLQWNLLDEPGGINVSHAWKLLNNSKKNDVIVAVMDTGIFSHQALDKNLIYVSYDGEHITWDVGPKNSEDAGVSFTDNGDYWMLGASPSCKKCQAAMHGTHVAGIIASSGELAYGETVFGVAPNSHILPINVFTKIDDPDICDGLKNTPCAISYAADQLNAQSWLDGQVFSGIPAPPKVNIINLSIGGLGGCSRIAQESFNRLLNKHMTVVAAAGNSNIDAEKTYPAGCPQVISVAATGPSGEKAWYSNWGKSIAIAAPGGNSLNPILNTPNNQVYSTISHAYKFLQGTSMASPMVAGVIALMYTLEPNLNQKQILRIITKPSNTTEFPKEVELLPSLISCINNENTESLCGAGIINATKVIQHMLTHQVSLSK